MTKKYTSHRHNTGFWQNLATLLAPSDEKLLYATRIIHKTAANPEEDQPRRLASMVAGPSRDQACLIPNC